MSAPIAVVTEGRRLPAADPLRAYLALAEDFGRDQVYLLESPAGPAFDRRHSFVGFGEVLAVSVTREMVRVTGAPRVVAAVRDRTRDLLEPRRAGSDRQRLVSAGAVWDLVRRLGGLFSPAGSSGGFEFGFLAFFGYDAARHIERLPYLIDPADPGVDPGAELPEVCLVLHQGCLRFDVATGSVDLLVHSSDAWPPVAAPAVAARLARLGPARPGVSGTVPLPRWRSTGSVTRGAFLAGVERCLAHIAVGDVYQVQIGHELTIDSPIDPVEVYRRLRLRSPSPYMYLAPLAGHLVVGASPELFVRIEHGTVTMRPLAGTLPCGTGRDAGAAARTLRADPKEIAEHVMLVDLCRNDIGRICRQDSLDVPDMLGVERFSRVLHLISTVVGRLDDGVDGWDVIAAAFPAGTMVGAPKIRAMEIIESVETTRRGLYAGALGLIDVGGYLNMALCIRTLVHRGDRYRARASAGVVVDSVPEREWRETLAKMSAAHWAVTGKELLP